MVRDTGFEAVAFLWQNTFFLLLGQFLGQNTTMATEKKPVGKVHAKDVRYFNSPVVISGKSYPSWRITYYRGTTRVRERRKTEKEAKARAEELVEKLGDGTIHFDLKLKPKDNLIIAEALALLRDAGGKTGLLEAVRQFTEAEKCLAGKCGIMEAVRGYKAQLDKEKLPEITVPDLVVKFLDHITAEGLTMRYKVDVGQKLKIAAKTFSGQVAEIKTVDVDNWLDKLAGVSKRTKRNYRNALRSLFSFARDKGYLPRHQDTEIQFARDYKPEKPKIGIYTPEQLEILLSRITPRLVPFVALGGLAGMRSAEIVRMQWRDIRLDTNQIFVSEPVAKTIAREIPICPALAAWLKPFKQAADGSDKVLARISGEFALAKRFTSAVEIMNREEGKPQLQTVHNGLRHTYISCRIKLIKNKHEVALEAGNSPRIIDSNYLRVIEDKEQANQWFNIFPTPERLDDVNAAIAAGL